MRHAIITVGIINVALSLAIGSASAAESKYTADLRGGSEVPAVATPAKGMVDATYDSETMKLSWKIDYSDLTGDPTAAHFHGPAGPAENAPPMVPVEITNIKDGMAVLTKEQADELASGMLYFNLHTARHPKGEIRGQLRAAN